jgi:phospholipid transport system transporter-binding protein
MLTLPEILTHAASAQFALGLKQAVASQPAQLVANASGLREFDSSALALLLACRREAVAAGKVFSVQDLPARLRQLAGLYGVAELLPDGATALA